MNPYKLVQPYKRYFQKSKAFLYPALGIRRGAPVVPEQTYISWRDRISAKDKKLIVVYELTGSNLYEHFERNTLLRHPLFEDFYMCEELRGVYVFSFKTMSEDWDHFIQGEYSLLSVSLKGKIRTYFGPVSNEYAYMDSFLYPNKYYDTYAELLGLDREILEAGVELADPFDPKKEHFRLSISEPVD